MVLSITEIEERDGKLLRFTDVPAYILKISGVKVGRDAVYTWAVRKGKRSYTGRLVKLRCIRSCGLWLTTERWVEEFLRKLNK